MSMKRRRTVRLLGAGLAVLVPALAIAAFNVPHAFQSGEVLTAQNLNDNFNAVKTELESLQARVAALEANHATKAEVNTVAARVTSVEATAAELSRVSLSKCQWHWQTCNAAMSVECQLTCPSGTYPIAGGCDSAAGNSVSEHRPSVSMGMTFPATPSSPKAYNIYTCESADGVTQNTYALCCPL